MASVLKALAVTLPFGIAIVVAINVFELSQGLGLALLCAFFAAGGLLVAELELRRDPEHDLGPAGRHRPDPPRAH